jgi:hypothetical protein
MTPTTSTNSTHRLNDRAEKRKKQVRNLMLRALRSGERQSQTQR